MSSGTEHVWIMTADYDLIRSDVLTWLRCEDGIVQTMRPDGALVRLAGPGCPPGFHLALLREMEIHNRARDDRWTVIITAEITTGVCRWASAQLDDIIEMTGLKS